MAELFIELFSEEIPARMQARAARGLAGMVKELLSEHDLGGREPESYSTPRRLVCVINDVREKQEDRSIERRGPRVDAPEKAREGFLRGIGDQPYRLEEIEDRKGRFLLAVIEQKGRSTVDILAEKMPLVLQDLPWPKSMRWGQGDAHWVRPLKRITCLFDGTIVPFEFAGVASGRTSEGHRFLAPGPFDFSGFADYADRLEAHRVVLDPDMRRQLIVRSAEILASAEDLCVRSDEGLVDELVGLVECPVAVMGRIETDFMTLPAEVLVTSMREHQKFLAVEDGRGELAPWFITIANIESEDDNALIRAGNEYVLRARLWDARFFWEQDRKKPLEQCLASLDSVVFHAELGSLGEKAGRMEMLARLIAEQLDIDGEDSARAAKLAKADLMTGMVGEFPELQGIMGGYYARVQGERDRVADAIRDHYRPQGPSDDCPREPVSIAVALADKIDTLIGFFAAGIRPTGSKDPFALRRAALGVIRLIGENEVRLHLMPVFAAARAAYGSRFAHAHCEDDVLDFLIDRLKVFLRTTGRRHDIIEAVLSGTQHDDLVNLIDRIEALDHVMASPEGHDLLAACKRAMNILAIEEKRDGEPVVGAVDSNILQMPAEKDLFGVAQGVANKVRNAMASFNVADALSALTTLREPMDRFFDNVLVNDEDSAIRRNRLRLLAAIRDTANSVATMSLIEDHVKPGEET